jgi:hypothetical protein
MRAPLVIGAAALAIALVGVASAQSGAVALQVRPTELRPTQSATLLGRISSRRSGEVVRIEARHCGQTSYRTVTQVRTPPGGTFRLEWAVGINATFRARWRGAVSRPVLVRQQPFVQIDQTGASEFEVGVGSLGLMWRKRVEIQRRTGGRWQLVRRVTLTDTHAGAGSSGVWTDADVRLSVPVGTQLRAVLTAAQARPCYLGSTSNVIRTQG